MLQTNMTSVADLSHDELRAEAVKLARQERLATAALIRCLMEVDVRRLYLAEGYSSLFTFCTQLLHLSEHAALGRIEVARAARRVPKLLSHLEDGAITVTNARLLAPHLTEANCELLLASARHRSKREVEEIVARLRPQADVRSAVRKLPSPPASHQPPVPAPRVTIIESPREDKAAPPPTPARPVIAPLAPERYKIQFTASKELLDKLRYAQDLILPAAVRREVWQRDGGRCAFIGAHGRCRERAFLEFHHVPFAAGGRADVSNIQLRCRAHNLYEADLFFGVNVVRESTARWGDSNAHRSRNTPPASRPSNFDPVRCYPSSQTRLAAPRELWWPRLSRRQLLVPDRAAGRTDPCSTPDAWCAARRRVVAAGGGAMTRNMLLRLELFLLMAMASAGCQLVEGVFKAGMWVGILLVVVVLGIVFMVFGRSST
jgi:hypothetical protein